MAPACLAPSPRNSSPATAHECPTVCRPTPRRCSSKDACELLPQAPRQVASSLSPPLRQIRRPSRRARRWKDSRTRVSGDHLRPVTSATAATASSPSSRIWESAQGGTCCTTGRSSRGFHAHKADSGQPSWSLN
ncbi:hypothetical protein PSPO01_13423 [Paraphaeosphaeria sporulosa]